MGQGANRPGNESSRERIGQGSIGRFAPGSELARERKGSVPNGNITSHHIETTDAGLRNQSTRHTVNSSHHKMVWRVDHRVWRCCDKLTVLLDPAFVAFKSFAVVSDFDIAHAAITCHVVHVCATSRFFQISTPTNNCFTNHPCYDTVILNPNIETELHGTVCQQKSWRNVADFYW